MKWNKFWNKLNVYFFFYLLKRWNAQVHHVLNMLKSDLVLAQMIKYITPRESKS